MPKAKKITYTVENRKHATFAKATEAAVDMALRTGEDITIVESSPTATYHITVTAQSEQVA